MSTHSGYDADIQNEIEDQISTDRLPVPRMTAAIRSVLATHEVEPETTLSVVVTGDEQVRLLNERFRGIDAPTDILSFPADPLPDDLREAMSETDDEPPYLGDLIIAYPYTVRHAAEAGHPVDDELVLLVIHGTLHLLGYDHDNDEHQERMWAAQARALAEAGLSLDVPRFTFGDEIP